MFTKALIFVLLGTSLVLANPLSDEVAEQQQVDKTWREKVNEFLHKIEGVLVEYFNKSRESLQKVIDIVKQKSKDIAESLSKKWVKLQDKYQIIKENIKKAIEEKKKIFLEKVQEIKEKGKDVAEKMKEYAEHARSVLQEEYAKFEAKIKEWLQESKQAIAEAKKALQEKSFEDTLNKIIEKFGEYANVGKETLTELKDEYFKLKELAKVAIANKKQELKDQLSELKDTAPQKYQELKENVAKILAEETAKWESLINQLKEKIADVIEQIKNNLNSPTTEYTTEQHNE